MNLSICINDHIYIQREKEKQSKRGELVVCSSLQTILRRHIRLILKRSEILKITSPKKGHEETIYMNESTGSVHNNGRTDNRGSCKRNVKWREKKERGMHI
jgi:hypothetical protein